MCGITGFIDLRRQTTSEQLKSNIGKMVNALVHRGPDMGDQWIDPEVGMALGFRRLAVIDLTPTGHQPMTSNDGRFIILFNGEAYNFLKLRKELEVLGHKFKGQSDTEVILEGCVAWGVENTIARIVGMFAFALWDRKERRLWLGRDRLGIKPLYYGKHDNLFLFGSELKALRANSGWKPEIDLNALTSYFRFNYVPTPQSIYKKIHKLEAGTLLSMGVNEEPTLKRYWDLSSLTTQDRSITSEEEALEECERLVSNSVKSCLVADVPLGVLLSGGIDSSTVAAFSQVAGGSPVKSFTIGFEQTGFDEAQHAKAVAKHIGTEHRELYVTDSNVLELVPNLVDWYDEPFADASALPTWLVAHMARQEVTVALSGDGGDEVFLGYNRYNMADIAWRTASYTPNTLRQFAAKFATAIPTASWDSAARIIPQTMRPTLFGDKVYKLASILEETEADGIYRRLVSHWHEPEQLVRNGIEINSREWEDAKRIKDFTERMAFIDTKTYLPDDVLTKVDRASMSVSLEVRVPLLDHRLVEFAWRLPKKFKISGLSSKRLLRSVLHRHVPRNLVDRPKAGFAVPLDQWLRGPLKDWAESLIDEVRLKREGLLDPIPVRNAWADHLAGRGNAGQALWGVLLFQCWREHWKV